MKRILLLPLIFLAVVAGAQYNLPTDLDHEYCNHAKSAGESLKSWHEPVVSSELLEDYDVTFYFLDLEVEENSTDIAGTVTIRAHSLVNGLEVFAFELIPEMVIESVTVDGASRLFDREGDLVTVSLPAPVPQGGLVSVSVTYAGTPPSGGFFSGVTTGYDSQYDKNVTWTLSEPYAAKDWFPVKMDLYDKADSVWVFLTTSNENIAGSQGLLKAVTAMPGNKLRYEWKSYYPIAYYLISFAVADYQEYNIWAYPQGTADSVFIQNFIYDHPLCLPNNQEGIDNTVAFMELFSDLFGLYPFIDEKYGHCLTELGGGMEHQTMTTIGGFGFGLVAHELGHMWFGDKVTCATWSDIWINEGFATYSDYLAHSFLTTPYYDSLWLKIRHDQVKAQPGGSVYVPEDELGNVWRIFDGRLSYSKGALLLHMIRFELQDDELFFEVLQTYMEEYGDSVATGDDFREWLELISGRDFTDFFNQWYYGEGYPLFDITWHEDTENLYITSTQTTSTPVTTLFKMLVPFYVEFTDGSDTTLLLFQDANVNSWTVATGREVERITVDPDQWILHKVNSLVVLVEETDDPLHFTLGPNPADDYVKVFVTNPSAKVFELNISDMTGRSVLKKSLQGETVTVALSTIPAGVYVASLSNGSGKYIRKFVVE
jgi:aminopeptidase N